MVGNLKQNIINNEAYHANLSIKHIFLRKKEKNLVDVLSRFHLPNCQYLINLNFENSFVNLISLAQNQEKLTFEY